MSLLGSLLPSILSVIRPDKIINGIVNTAAGVLGSIAKGESPDLAGNISRGLRTIEGNQDQSLLGSIGGQSTMEPKLQEKLMGTQNVSNVYNTRRMEDMQDALHNAASNNVANNKPVYSEDTTRSQLAAPVSKNLNPFYPESDNGEISRITETNPGGFPGNRQSFVRMTDKPLKVGTAMRQRDENGYRAPNGTASSSTQKMPRFDVIKKKKRRSY